MLGAEDTHEPLREELLAMSAEDQRIRRAVIDAEKGGVVQTELTTEWERIDTANTDRLAEIVARYGWPRRSMVGEDGAKAAWLLAQHADRRRDLQESFLGLMRETTDQGEASMADVALLVDRVAVNRGEPQTYGTQMTRTPEGDFRPLPIAEPDGVEARRAAAGLNTIAEYIEALHEVYRPR